MMQRRSNARSAFLVVTVALLVACSSEEGESPAPGEGGGADAVEDTTGADAESADDAGDGEGSADADEGDTTPEPTGCADGSEPRVWQDGPYGTLRHDLAGDFELPLVDGTTWSFAESWNGCESYVFIPDTVPISESNRNSIWLDGVVELIERSPRNAHYVFVSRQLQSAGAEDSATILANGVESALALLSDEDAAHWRARLHVSPVPASRMDAWIGGVMDGGIGQSGFAIDRFQRIRGVGSYADVTRVNQANQWPWEANIASMTNEVVYFNFEAERAVAMAEVDAVEVTFWDGEILEEYEDTTVTMPTAEEMEAFDTLEIYIEGYCPDENSPELGNCGAWDYLAHFWLFVGEGEEERRIEIARFITPYHREATYLVDATHALPWLAEGGDRKFRWEFAPSWNTQPTATKLTLRFSNQNRGVRPVATVELYGDRAFNENYNVDRPAIDVDIPANASRVELRSIITGHGGDTQNCAEFCNHQHEFLIDGRSYFREHPDIGNDRACEERVSEGVVPNQSGTWWFGRGGWCPGQHVTPWVEDLTDIATPGESVNVEYYGYLGGRTPPANAGNIRMSSWIVVYE